ncbi:YciI family protein [Aeromicrobium sp. UC242_57]|uniref:YciI family protein n=1 Tax=Aeromicrobium sp. UC242_57 TaxID=3374624 RepID=UPI0037A56D19
MVTDGPYAEAKELFNGFWIIQTSTKEEAAEWAKRCPLGPGTRLEVRRVTETEEFDQSNEYVQKEYEWREQLRG